MKESNHLSFFCSPGSCARPAKEIREHAGYQLCAQFSTRCRRFSTRFRFPPPHAFKTLTAARCVQGTRTLVLSHVLSPYRTHAHAHADAQMKTLEHNRTHSNTTEHTHTQIHKHTHTHKHTTQTHTNTYTHTQIYTYTHTHPPDTPPLPNYTLTRIYWHRYMHRSKVA